MIQLLLALALAAGPGAALPPPGGKCPAGPKPVFAPVYAPIPAPATAGLLGLGTGHEVREVAGVRVVLWDRRQPPPAVSGTLFRLQTPGGPAADFPGRRLTERQQVRQLALERWDAAP